LRVDKLKTPVRNQVADKLKNGTPKDQLGNGIDSGHTFLYVPGGGQSGSGAGVGFYPDGSWRGKPGELSDDTKHGYTHYRDYQACPETQKLIQDKIREDSKNPPVYDILDSQYGDSTAQCTTWACETLSDAGIQGVPQVNEPYDLSSQSGFHPKP
jgi:hypothetical protein